MLIVAASPLITFALLAFTLMAMAWVDPELAWT